MQVSPQLASPQGLHRREAALPADTHPRDLRRNPRMQRAGETSWARLAILGASWVTGNLVCTVGGNLETTKKGGTNWVQTISLPGPSRPPVLTESYCMRRPSPSCWGWVTDARLRSPLNISSTTCWERPVGVPPNNLRVHRLTHPGLHVPGRKVCAEHPVKYKWDVNHPL